MILLPSLFALASYLALPGTVGTLRISDTTAAYVSRAIRGGDGAIYSIDTAPRLAIDLSWKRRVTLSVGYGPRFSGLKLPSTPAGTPVNGTDQESRSAGTRDSGFGHAILHGADASITHNGPRFRLLASYALVMGTQYLANLVQPTRDAGMRIDPTQARTALLPNANRIDIRSQYTNAGVGYAWTRRFSSDLGGGYTSAGGTDCSSRSLWPRQRAWVASVSLTAQLTPQHGLVSAVQGQYIRTRGGTIVDGDGDDMEDGPRDQDDVCAPGPGGEPYEEPRYRHRILSFGETWRAQWTRLVNTTLSAGVQVQRSRTPDGYQKPKPGPSVAASVTSALPFVGRAKASGQWGLSVAPFVNILTGELQMTGQTSALFEVSILKTKVRLSLDGYQTLPVGADNASSILGTGAAVIQEVTDWFDVGGGARLQVQRVAFTEALPTQWVVSLGIGLHAPAIKF